MALERLAQRCRDWPGAQVLMLDVNEISSSPDSIQQSGKCFNRAGVSSAKESRR
jgi:hypothetical protein